MSSHILRLPAVRAKTGKGRSSIYDDIKKGTFPPPISLGPRAVGWLESSVEEWIQGRIQLSTRQGGQQ